tara:strand:+ start:4659 stop:5006 length:348 start_codon:yes stop_codon:yes gene_type:complete
MEYESDTLRFIVICIFFIVWLIISIIPGGGILGDLIFRAIVPGVPAVDPFTPVFNYIMSFFSFKDWLPWNWTIWSILNPKWWKNVFSYIFEFLIDIIPIIGPIINFLRFLKKGYF